MLVSLVHQHRNCTVVNVNGCLCFWSYETLIAFQCVGEPLYIQKEGAGLSQTNEKHVKELLAMNFHTQQTANKNIWDNVIIPVDDLAAYVTSL